MSIKSITIGNFKGIRDKVKIDLKPVTLLFGQNSGGKSTIIQALHYAWEVMVRHNLDPNFTELGGKEIDLGGFENIVYAHDKARSISLRFDLDLTDKELPIYIDHEHRFLAESTWKFGHEDIFCWSIDSKNISTAWVQIKISWNQAIGRFEVSTYEVGLNEELIARIQVLPGDDRAKIVYINFLHPLLTLEQKEIKKALEKVLDEEGSKGFGYEMIKDFKELIDKLSAKPELWLDQKVFPSDEYERLSKITDKVKECLEMAAEEIRENFRMLTRTRMPGEKKLNEEETDKYLESLEKWADTNIALKSKYGISNYDFYAAFAPYVFLFFCLDQLGLKSTIGDLDIGIGKGDALPNFEDNHGLKIEIDSSDRHKILNYDDSWIEEGLRAAISQFVVGPGQILRDELKKLHYLGPIRSRIPRDYVPNRFAKNLNWADGMAAWDVLHKEEEEFIRQVNNWLADRLKSGYSMIRKSYKEIDTSEIESGNANSEKIVQQFNSAPTKTRLFLKDEKNGVEVQPPDVGTGISQVLPVIVSALHFKKGIVAIEQPELHLHPALQAEIGDVFLQSALGENHNRFLIETHSEHLLLRIMRRMRETAFKELAKGYPHVTPDDVTVLFVEVYESGTIVREMPLNKHGELVKAWPGGFFEEGLREVF